MFFFLSSVLIIATVLLQHFFLFRNVKRKSLEEHISSLKEELVSVRDGLEKSTLNRDVLEQEKVDVENALMHSDLKRSKNMNVQHKKTINHSTNKQLKR
jgi:hypothetical protein